ncbi:RNA polymerase II mediator complex subunit [Neophaeococcomyces mojaviensis]|uniref:RNA polymerase II mediator complex subunit n=1 Tax=Neophaeococcomyces mojaviensis TaxID=3383035 RepID=A0ACC3A581_9EURO|nr:RNA polymerase II mediator complex subunit [Knufia sp. JES_112]
MPPKRWSCSRGVAVSTKPTTEPTASQPRKKGKAEPLPDGDPPHTAFLLSLKIPSLKDHVAQHGLSLFSTRASIFEFKRDEIIRVNNEKLVKIQQLEQRRLQQQEGERARKKLAQARVKRRQKETQVVKDAVREVGGRTKYDRVGFFTFRYNSIRFTEAINEYRVLTRTPNNLDDTTSQTLASAPQTAPPQSSTSWKGLPVAAESRTNGSSIAPNTTSRSSSIPEAIAKRIFERPEISLITPTAPFAQVFGPEPPLTPADSNDSRRQSLLQPLQQAVGQASPTEPREPTEPSEPITMPNQPVQDLGGVDDKIKDVIQSLYEFQQHVHGFRPEQQERMIEKVEDIASSLKDLDTVTKDESNPIQNVRVAPDIIDYVDAGRNPDIYTREFIELVQRGNSVMNGKQKAFRDFSKIFAQVLKDNFDGMDDEVDTIMRHAGMEERDGAFVEMQQNGHRA